MEVPMYLTNEALEDFVLPDQESIEDCALFAAEPNIEPDHEDRFSGGSWADSPEDISKWLEESSRKFSH